MLGMSKSTMILYDGRTKRVHALVDDPKHVITEFKDKIPIENVDNTVVGRAKLACKTTSFLMQYLAEKGVDTHLVEKVDETRIKCLKSDVFPTRVVCRNISTSAFADRIGIERNLVFGEPIIDFYLEKNEKVILVSRDTVRNFANISNNEITLIESVTASINYYLQELFKQIDLSLAEIRLRFGRTENGKLVLTDEISGETMSIMKKHKVGSYIFPCNVDDTIASYENLLERLEHSNPDDIPTRFETLYVEVMPREEVRDPSGQAVMRILKKAGIDFIEDGRMGRVFRIKIKKPLTSGILSQISEVSLGLLSNPLSEYHELRV